MTSNASDSIIMLHGNNSSFPFPLLENAVKCIIEVWLMKLYLPIINHSEKKWA